MEISKKDMKVLLKSQQGELDAVLMYNALAARWILYPAIAQDEYAAVKNYAPVAEKFPEVESVKNDEKRHGDTVKGLLNNEQDGQFPDNYRISVSGKFNFNSPSS